MKKINDFLADEFRREASKATLSLFGKAVWYLTLGVISFVCISCSISGLGGSKTFIDNHLAPLLIISIIVFTIGLTMEAIKNNKGE
jgi:hypothetical protein